MKKLLLVLLLVILVCFAFGCKQQPLKETKEQMTREQAKALLDDVLAIWNEKKLELIEKDYAPDAVIKTSSIPQALKGTEGLKTWLNNSLTSFPDHHLTLDEFYVDGNVIIAKWTATGTNTGPLTTPFGEIPATGKPFSISCFSFDRVNKGLIIEEEVVFNTLEMLLQIGFKVTPPSKEE